MKVVIACGGTGGHILPAVVLADELTRWWNCEVVFAVTRRSLDSQILARYLYQSKKFAIDPLKIRQPAGILRFCAAILMGLFYLLKEKPDVVVGMGSYISVPVAAAAVLLGIPLLVHEQNFAPGKANKFLSNFAVRIAVAFPDSKNFFAGENVVMCGNPVRSGICTVSGERAGKVNGKVTILILGGSQGAHSINKVAQEAIARISRKMDIDVIHITGNRDFDRTKAGYAEAGVTAAVYPFVHEMEQVYAACDIVISRAGAMTLSEISCCGLPSILIPYPHQDGHQLQNADLLKKTGAAVVIEEKELSTERLQECLWSMVTDTGKMLEMGKRSRIFACHDATERLAVEVLKTGYHW
jgi:UDP-N-acetylglucosamine--N-acetylmuramyl-(pentapeptide) pyrophosphoryl-undecaprenol N-acetylglucosamine transferase